MSTGSALSEHLEPASMNRVLVFTLDRSAGSVDAATDQD